MSEFIVVTIIVGMVFTSFPPLLMSDAIENREKVWTMVLVFWWVLGAALLVGAGMMMP